MHKRITWFKLRVERLFVLAYNNKEGDNNVSTDSFKRYFLPRVKTKNYNIEIDGKDFYDQPINHSVKQYDEIRKISTGQGDNYTTGCLLDFAYFEKKLQINCSWFKQTKSFRCWFKGNPTIYCYWKNKSNRRKYK